MALYTAVSPYTVSAATQTFTHGLGRTAADLRYRWAGLNDVGADSGVYRVGIDSQTIQLRAGADGAVGELEVFEVHSLSK